MKLIDAKGSTTSWSYDTQNRLKRKTYADGNYDEYSYSGNQPMWQRSPDRAAMVV